MQQIETPRLILRKFTLEDLDTYHEQIYGDAEVTRYLPGGQPRPKEHSEMVLNYFIDHDREHGFSPWAVIDRVSGQLLGHCGLIHVLDEPEVEIIYALGKSTWGKGLATEAASACLDHAYNHLDMDEIIALAYPENTASQRVMQKLGMQDEGATDLFYNAELALYTIYREEYEAAQVNQNVEQDQL